MTENHNSSLSLYQLMNMVDDAVRDAMPSTYWVRAEVLNVHHRGYYRLELSSYEDAKAAKATAMIWQSRKHIVEQFEKAAGTRLATGLKILVRLEVGFDAQYGLRLTVVEFDPAFSLGDMEARLNAIRSRLTDLGEIERNRQLPEPLDFTRVAVVSPESAAGLGDFRTQADMLQQYGLCDFSYFPALFQSEKNDDSILAALGKVVAEHKARPYDALVVIRGGGDKAGLYELNKIKIARGICRMPMPVLVGVGHERDATILDELASRSFATPSLVVAHILNAVIDNARAAGNDHLQLQKQAMRLLEKSRQDCVNSNQRLLRHAFDKITVARQAAQAAHFTIRTGPLELLAGCRRTLEHQHTSLQRNAENAVLTMRASIVSEQVLLMSSASRTLEDARERVTTARTTLLTTSRETLLTQRHSLLQLKQAASTNTRLSLQTARHAIQQFNTTIKHLDPKNVLQRGFVLVLSGNGSDKNKDNRSIVTNSHQAAKQNDLILRFRDGEIKTTVDNSDKSSRSGKEET